MYKKIIAASALAALLTACGGEDIIGEVNGRKITRDEFNQYLKTLKHLSF